MARSQTMPLWSSLVRFWTPVLSAVMLSPAIAAADLNGRWSFNFGPSGFTDIIDAGGSVSFVLSANGFDVSFSGSVVGSSLNAVDQSGCYNITAAVAPDQSSINGTIFLSVSCGAPAGAPITMQRCTCFDGNSSNGDGCDAQCQIEECYSCSGDPSVCTPLADGTPCNDHSVCTTGESCSSVMCGGGSAVPSCVDMTGAWHLHYSYPDFQYEIDGVGYFTQRDTTLSFGEFKGTIDPFTGVFSLDGLPEYFCPGDHLAGQVALDGQTLTGVLTDFVMTPTQCPGFNATVTGSRCGGGTLDAGEECDDGNVVNGDGCDATCHAEQCFTCTGSPSTCGPVPNGVSCDDGETCTSGDTCQSGNCSGTPEQDGTSCTDGDICTLNDACLNGACTGTPLACGQCAMCDGIGPACVPKADFTPCDDGNACTNGDACQGGSCAAGSATFCLPCTSCDSTGQCVPTPATGCLTTTAQSSLFFEDLNTSADDTVAWRWRHRADGTPVVLADPSQAAAALCVYDESTTIPTMVFSGVAQQLACPSSGCWTSIRHGFRYRDSSGDTGFSRIDLRARADGRIRIRTKSQGAFPSGIPTPPFGLPVRAQFQIFDANLQVATCFEAQYDGSAVSTNADGVFRARETGP